MPGRSIVYDLIANPKRLQRGFADAQRSADKFHDRMQGVGSGVAAAFTFGAIAAGVKTLVAAAEDSQKVAKQTDAVIRSTGASAKLSAEGFSDLASSISKKTAVDDEVIQSGENILATFTNVRNEVGKGNDIFSQATMAAVDLAAAMNGGEVTADGLKTANIQLGKALNDPIKGMGALQRVGVTFTEQQKHQIQAMVDSGNVMGAQKIILAELTKEFGGSAEASKTAGKEFGVAMGNVQEALGTALLPSVNKAAEVLTNLADGFTKFDEETNGVASTAVLVGVAVGGLGFAIGKTITFVKDAKAAWAALRATKILQIGTNEALAVSEGQVAAQTAASGAATKTAASGWQSWAAAIPAVGTAIAVVTENAQDLKKNGLEHGRFLDPATLAITKLGSALGVNTENWFRNKAALDSSKSATDANKKATDAQRLSTAQLKQITGEATTKEEEALLTKEELKKKIDKVTTSLKTVKDQYKQEKQSIQESIVAHDGLISKSDVTAKEVVADIKNQVLNFKTYSRDVKKLIKDGVSPAAIQELSKRGPEYIHALATGSNDQLKLYKKYWGDRQKEIKGSFEASMQKQFENLVDKIKAMQKEINSLKGKTVNVKAEAEVEIKESTRQGLLALGIKGYGTKFFAEGGPVYGPGGPRADKVPAMLSNGEFVVNAAATRQNRGLLEQINAQRYADGGLVGGFLNPAASATQKYGQLAAKALSKKAGKGIAGLVDDSVFGGGILGPLGRSAKEIIAFIRAADRLPYIWGGVGPRGYDCSGLVGEVWARTMGKPSFRRYWTTFTGLFPMGFNDILKTGTNTWMERAKGAPGGYRTVQGRPKHAFTVGLSRNSFGGHTAGNFLGLGFEAANPRAGIRVGRGAKSPWSFETTWYLPQADKKFAGQYDKGGWLPPGLSLAYNGTGKPERIPPPGASGNTYNINVTATATNPSEVGREVVEAIRAYERGAGKSWRN